jgi:hypothetical protein
MHRPFKKPWQKKENLIMKKHISRPPVRQRAAFFRRCGKRKR